MPRPLIGITLYGPDEDLIAPAVSLPIAYAESVARAGGVPLLLPPVTPVPDDLLAALGGLILAGGGDIDPALHGAQSHPTVYGVNARRDRFELELAQRALERPELCVLGICRGMQILNVALGGDLEVHLPDVHGEQIAHRKPPRTPVQHDVVVEADSPLAELYPELGFPVCSWHHQGVRRVGRDLEVCARAPDGVIEGLSYARHPFAIGIQWHPEMQPDDALQQGLFEAFVRRAGGTG